MRMTPFRALFPIAVLTAALPAAAQSFDPATQARGWAHQDRDFSFTFYDPASRSLVTWDKGFGVMNTLSVAKMGAVPSMWLMDRYNNAWVVSGDTLYFITKDGKLDHKEKLPAEAGDVAWDSQTGFLLSYKTASPYLEMRDMKDGSVLWSHGQRPKKGEGTGHTLFRVCMKTLPGGDSQAFFTDGPGLDMTVLNGKTGDPVVHTEFKLNGHAAPVMDYGKADPGPVCPYIGKEIVFAAVDSTTLPAAAAQGLNGLLLARLDLTSNTLALSPTGLTPDNHFIGIVDGQAVFIKPGGGLAEVAVQ
ncbi:MAG TPA: hypothetical protein VL181_00390 [Holophagaceae bacterium]|nr:hypothetical protein [Holophagaceae bacterium]